MLRHYQTELVRQVIECRKRGHTRIVVCSPTGTGKTEMMAELCRLAKFPLVIEHLNVLLEQTKDRLESRLGEVVDIEQGGRFAESIEGLRKRIIVGSRDSLLSRNRYKLKAYDRLSLVLVDECHHGNTTKMHKMLEHYEQQGATIVGFSATPHKGYGKALRWWPRPQCVYTLKEALNDAYLVPPKCFLSEAKSYDLTMVEQVAGDWNRRQLEAVLAAEHCGQEVTSLVLSTFRRQPSVVYAAGIRQATMLSEMFDRYGMKTALVHSRQNLVERKANMDAFANGETPIIINVGILSFGWDFPELRNVYMAAPCRTLSRYEQRIGRGMRPLSNVIKPGMTVAERRAAIAASGKTHFNLYDITSSSAGHQLMSIWDILDRKSKTRAGRRQKLIAAQSSPEGVDPLEAIKELDDLEKTEAEEAARELRDKRRNLIVGVTFDHNSRDLFSDPQKAGRGWRMMYGKYKGEKLSHLPTDYLQYVADSQKKATPFKAAVIAEIAYRRSR